MTLLRSTKGFRKTLDGVAMVDNEHDGNSGDFTNTTLQILIARSNNVATVLRIRKPFKSSYVQS